MRLTRLRCSEAQRKDSVIGFGHPETAEGLYEGLRPFRRTSAFDGPLPGSARLFFAGSILPCCYSSQNFQGGSGRVMRTPIPTSL